MIFVHFDEFPIPNVAVTQLKEQRRLHRTAVLYSKHKVVI